MVTCRQIKQLAAARIAGEKPLSQATHDDKLPRIRSPPAPPPPPPSIERLSGGEEQAPQKSLKPFRFPTTPENQLQIVRTIKRALIDLNAYLETNAVTLAASFPSASRSGLVNVTSAHSWLCSLKREQKDDGACPTGEEKLSPFGDYEKMLKTLEVFFDPDRSGKASAKSVVEAFYLARRVATRRRQDEYRRTKFETRREPTVAPEFDSVYDDKSREGNDKRVGVAVEKSLVSKFGVLRQADIHELVDIFFSDSDEPSGFVATITLEDLEAQMRLLRRVWAVSRNGATPTSTPKARNVNKKEDESEGETWEQLTQRAASLLASLEDFLARKQAMRLMDFVRVIPEVARDSAERVRMEDLRMALLKLFDVPLQVQAREKLRAAKRERQARAKARQVERDAIAKANESRLRNAGVGPLLRRVDCILKRRGIRLGEAVDLARIDEFTISTKKFAALVKAAVCARNPLKHQNSQRSQSYFEGAELGNKERREMSARLRRMQRAEKTGVLVSFGRLDRFFRRYQLTAEGIWDLGQSPRLGEESTKADDEARTFTHSQSLSADDLYKFLQRSQISFRRDQVRDIFRYLDKDGNGKVDYNELDEALVDYRKFMCAKTGFNGQRSRLEDRLFLEHQATLVLQYIILIGGKKSEDHASIASFDMKRFEADAEQNKNDAGEECIRLVDMQSAIDVAPHQTVSQYFREIFDHQHDKKGTRRNGS